LAEISELIKLLVKTKIVSYNVHKVSSQSKPIKMLLHHIFLSKITTTYFFEVNMKSKIILFSLIFFLTTFGIEAQPSCNNGFNPFYVCQSGFEHSDFFFYGEVVSIERLENTFLTYSSAYLKVVVKVKKSFKGDLSKKIVLYLGVGLVCNPPVVKNTYLFQATNDTLKDSNIYFSEKISTPMTDYSLKALKEAFTGIDSALNNKNKKEDFVEGAIFEHLLRSRKVAMKKEDADRLSRDLREYLPLANLLLEAIGEKDGKVYQTKSKSDGTFRFDGLPDGLYKVKIHLQSDNEQTELFIFGKDSSSCSRKWYISVPQKNAK
jgi:hypothetical protein